MKMRCAFLIPERELGHRHFSIENEYGLHTITHIINRSANREKQKKPLTSQLLLASPTARHVMTIYYSEAIVRTTIHQHEYFTSDISVFKKQYSLIKRVKTVT